MAKAWSSLAELFGFLLPAQAEKLSSTAAAMRQAEMMEMLRQFGAGLRSFLLSISFHNIPNKGGASWSWELSFPSIFYS